MKIFFIVLAILLVALLLYYGIPFLRAVMAAKKIEAGTVPYEKISQDTSVSLLAIGDSTGVGLGASKPEDSVAGRFGDYLHATYVENNSVSGARVADLPPQIAKAKLAHYSAILIQIGANDIINFHDVSAVSKHLGEILDTLPAHDRAFLMMAGNVGGATIFPAPLRPFYTRLTLIYHSAFAEIAAAHSVVYVNLYMPPESDPFAAHPEQYLAADGLHPSSDGYALWAEKLFAAAKR